MFVNPEDLNVDFFLPIFYQCLLENEADEDRNLSKTIDGREFFAREP